MYRRKLDSNTAEPCNTARTRDPAPAPPRTKTGMQSTIFSFSSQQIYVARSCDSPSVLILGSDAVYVYILRTQMAFMVSVPTRLRVRAFEHQFSPPVKYQHLKFSYVLYKG